MNNAASKLGDGVFNPQFGFYGFTFQFTFSNGFQFVGFNPYQFAFQVAIALANEWLSCEEEERLTALKRGQSLCEQIDEVVCRKRVLGVCVDKEERHCCFNSKLAKIINRQGKAQLGMPLTDCSGFNESQLQSLDFSKMDFSEFIADIEPKDVPVSKISERVTSTVSDKVKNYYEN